MASRHVHCATSNGTGRKRYSEAGREVSKKNLVLSGLENYSSV